MAEGSHCTYWRMGDIPFWISLYISCDLLRNCEISPNEFLFISLFPLTVFSYLLKAKFFKGDNVMDANNATELKSSFVS